MSAAETADEQYARAEISAGREADLAGRILRGEIVASWLIECAKGALVLPRGLQVRRATIDGVFDLEAVQTALPLYLKNCTFTGKVILRNAALGTVSFEGGGFREVLDARDVKVTGQFILRHCVFDRPVLLRDARISGMVNVLGAEFKFAGGAYRGWEEEQSWGHAFSFARSTASNLKWQELTARPAGVVDLTDSRVGALNCQLDGDDFEKSWPTPGKLIMDGFAYERIDPVSVERALGFLELSPKFAPSSYRNLAAALRNDGLQHAAESVLARLQQLEINGMKSAWKRWFYKLVFGVTGYGLHAERALGWVAACFVVSLTIAAICGHYNYVAPKVNDLLLSRCYYDAALCQDFGAAWRAVLIKPEGIVRYVPHDYPEFSAFSFTVQKFFPFADLGQDGAWESSLPWINALIGAFGAAAVFFGGVFLGTVSGLLSAKKV